jgi:hypothetical protein
MLSHLCSLAGLKQDCRAEKAVVIGVRAADRRSDQRRLDGRPRAAPAQGGAQLSVTG